MADEFDNDPGFHEFARNLGINTGQPPAKGPAAPAGDEFDNDPGFHEFAKGLGINTGGVPAPKDTGGFMASAKQMVGSTIKGTGQMAADWVPGVGPDNALKRYGQEVVYANPTAIHSMKDFGANPGLGIREAAGNGLPSIGGVLGARMLGQGITAAAPLTGPFAPVTAAIGQGVSWLGPLLTAAAPSVSGIHDRQQQTNPEFADSFGGKLARTAGGLAVGAIENRFGPQEWAARAMTAEGKAALAKQFATRTLPGAIGRGVLHGGAVEGAEELVQNPIEQLAALQNPLTAENLKDTGFSGFMGAVGGGVIGGGMQGALHRPSDVLNKPKTLADGSTFRDEGEAFPKDDRQLLGAGPEISAYDAHLRTDEMMGAQAQADILNRVQDNVATSRQGTEASNFQSPDQRVADRATAEDDAFQQEWQDMLADYSRHYDAQQTAAVSEGQTPDMFSDYDLAGQRPSVHAETMQRLYQETQDRPVEKTANPAVYSEQRAAELEAQADTMAAKKLRGKTKIAERDVAVADLRAQAQTIREQAPQAGTQGTLDLQDQPHQLGLPGMDTTPAAPAPITQYSEAPAAPPGREKALSAKEKKAKKNEAMGRVQLDRSVLNEPAPAEAAPAPAQPGADAAGNTVTVDSTGKGKKATVTNTKGQSYEFDFQPDEAQTDAKGDNGTITEADVLKAQAMASKVKDVRAPDRKGAKKPNMPKRTINALRRGIEGMFGRHVDTEQKETAEQVLGEKTAGILRRIHDLAAHRDRLVGIYKNARNYHVDTNGTWRRTSESEKKGTSRNLVGMAERGQQDQVEKLLDTFYTERRAEITENAKQLSDAFKELEDEVGYNNVQAAQFLSKKKGESLKTENREAGKQGSIATRFSIFYGDLNSGQLSDTKALPTAVDAKDIRERREIDSKVRFTKVEDTYRDGYEFGQKKGDDRYKGFEAVLMKMRHQGNNPIASDIASRIYHMVKGLNVEMEFVHEKRGPNGELATYDTDTNTITLYDDGNNNETILHEGIHAALAGYIEKFDDPHGKMEGHKNVAALRDLMGHVVKQMSAAKNLSANMQSVLAELKDKGKGLHEFLSYGLTNGEFQRLMHTMKGMPAGASNGFFKNAWSAFARYMQHMMGISKDHASAFNDFLKAGGAVLETGGSYLMPKGKGMTFSEKAAPEGVTDYRKNAQTKGMLQKLFESWGYSPERIGNFSFNAISKGLRMIGVPQESAKLWANVVMHPKEHLQKVAPRVAQFMSYIDPRFSVSEAVSNTIDKGKTSRYVPLADVHEFNDSLTGLTADQQREAYAYLDAVHEAPDTTVPDLGKKSEHIAAKAKELSKTYYDLLNQLQARTGGKANAAAQLLQNMTVTEALLYVTDDNKSTGNTASGSFGTRNVTSLIGKTKETALTGAVMSPTPVNKQKVQTGKFFRYELTPAMQAQKDLAGETHGFVHEDMLAQFEADNPGIHIEQDVPYRLTGVSKDADTTRVSFRANQPVNALLAKGKQDHVNAALLNTVFTLSNAVASAETATNLKEHGQTADDQKDWVVYDDKEQFEKNQGQDHRLMQVGKSSEMTSAMLHIYRSPTAWVQMPDSAAYGALRGTIVRGPEYMALHDAYNRHQLFNSQTYSQILHAWKKSKTVYNIPTHAANILNNVTLLYMHNIPFSTFTDSVKLYYKYMTNPESLTAAEAAVMGDFKKSGAVLADHTTNEMQQTLYQSIDSAVHGDEGFSGMVKRMTTFKNKQAQAVVDLAKKTGVSADSILTKLYATEDNVFRLAAFQSKMGDLQVAGEGNNDTHIEEAGRHARTAFLNYDIDSRAVQMARQSFLPFVSWTYAIIPVLTRIAAESPWKMIQLGAAFSMLGALASAAAGGDDDDKARKREKMSDRLFGTFGPYTNFRIPFADAEGKKAYFNVGRYIPTPLSFKEQPNGFMGVRNMPGNISPNGPLIAFAAAGMGVDPYTGQRLYGDADSNMERFMKSGKYLTMQGLPPAVGQLERATKNNSIGQEADPMNVAQSLLGVVPKRVDTRAAAVDQASKMKGLDRTFAQAEGEVRTGMKRGNVSREDAAARLQELKERKYKLKNEALGRE